MSGQCHVNRTTVHKVKSRTQVRIYRRAGLPIRALAEPAEPYCPRYVQCVETYFLSCVDRAVIAVAESAFPFASALTSWTRIDSGVDAPLLRSLRQAIAALIMKHPGMEEVREVHS